MWLLLLYDTTRLHTGLNVRPTVPNVRLDRRAERALRPTPRQTRAWPHHVGSVLAHLQTCRVKHGAMQDTAAVRNPRVFQITAVDACPKRSPERKPTFGVLYWALLCIHFYHPILIFSNWQKHMLSLFFVIFSSNVGCSRLRDITKLCEERKQNESTKSSDTILYFSSSVEDQAA